jgi:hypothetical protein
VDPQHLRIIVATALATAGLGFTVLQLEHGVASMQGEHWIMLLVVLAVGYVLGRVWAKPATMVGLP